MENKPLEGKVAGIINERELAINLGSSHGVKDGMKFKVLTDAPTDIHDPVTGELLGSVDREKVRVKAVEVEEKFSICRTYRTVTRGNIPRGLGFWEPMQEIPETLKASKSSYLPPLSEEESFVKTGDRVIMIIDD